MTRVTCKNHFLVLTAAVATKVASSRGRKLIGNTVRMATYLCEPLQSRNTTTPALELAVFVVVVEC